MASVAFHLHGQVAATGHARLFESSGGFAAGEQRRDFVHVGDVVDVNFGSTSGESVRCVQRRHGLERDVQRRGERHHRWHGRGAFATFRFRTICSRAIRASRKPILRRCAKPATRDRFATCERASRTTSTRSARGRDGSGQSARRRPVVGGRHGDGAGAVQAVARAKSRRGDSRRRAAVVAARARTHAGGRARHRARRRARRARPRPPAGSWRGSCARERYTRAIVLPRSAKSALVPWFAELPLRTGFRGELRYGLLNDVRSLDATLDQTVKRFVALGRPRGDAPPSRCRRACGRGSQRCAQSRAAARGARAAPGAPLVALMPGAEYGPAKRWPAAHYGALAAELASAGADVVVLGSAKERAIGDEVVARAAHRARAQPLRRDVARRRRGSAGGGRGRRQQRLGPAARRGRRRRARRRDLRLVVAELHAAADGRGRRRLARARVQPVLRARLPAEHLRCLNDLSPATVLRAVDAVRASGALESRR